VDVLVTSTKVTVTLGTNAPQSFNRTATGGTSSITTVLTFDTTNWTGEWDSVRIAQ
jgi:hypothetical protein